MEDKIIVAANKELLGLLSVNADILGNENDESARCDRMLGIMCGLEDRFLKRFCYFLPRIRNNPSLFPEYFEPLHGTDGDIQQQRLFLNYNIPDQRLSHCVENYFYKLYTSYLEDALFNCVYQGVLSKKIIYMQMCSLITLFRCPGDFDPLGAFWNSSDLTRFSKSLVSIQAHLNTHPNDSKAAERLDDWCHLEKDPFETNWPNPTFNPYMFN